MRKICFIMKSRLFLATALGVGLTFGAATAQTPLLVTTGADSGPGSLRAALEEASAQENPAPIFVVSNRNIEITSTLTYSGQAPLKLFGNGQTIHSGENVTLLTLSEGADLSITNLNFRGRGGFSVTNRGDEDSAPGKGIFIDVREDQTGVVQMILEGVTISGVAYHGIHISDCDLADQCGGGGAPASISATLINVTIHHVGHGTFDADGIRIDERGDGDITFSAYNSTFRRNGADGIELDEGGDGSVFATIVHSRFLENGDYCDPTVLGRFLPSVRTAVFQDGEADLSNIPAPITGTPDDRCFERHIEYFESGSVKSYDISLDFEDGIDIDEAGDGDLLFTITDSEIARNYDQGVDLEELDAGNATISHMRSFSDHNTDDGFRTFEAGPGNLTGFFYEVGAWTNGGNGIRFEEEDEGTLSLQIIKGTTANNGEGEQSGIRVTKQGSGEGTISIKESDIRDGIDAVNVTVTEE